MSNSRIPMLSKAKWAFTTRHVTSSQVATLLSPSAATVAGDLVLARVERLGQHDGIQLRSGRRAELYVDDTVVMCLGDRYAPDQFEGIAQIDGDGRCDLLAGGGVLGKVRHKHVKMKAATVLRAIGCLADAQGKALNVASFAVPAPRAVPVTIPVILVVGSSMNAGKTSACASLIHGLGAAGWRVGAAKITGTGSFGDVQSYADAGAAEVLDFTDAGFASTYRVALPVLERVASSLIGTLQARGCDVAVVEIADGLFQTETAGLLTSPALRAMASGVLYAAADAMGAVAGVQRLHALGLPLVGFTGLVTCSPLAAAEAQAALATSHAHVPLYLREQLRSANGVLALAESAGLAMMPLAA